MSESNPVMKVITSMQDATGSSIKQIDHLHAETHLGKAYKAIIYSTNSVNSTTLYLQINGASGYEGHIKSFHAKVSEGLIDVKFFEASSTMTTGSSAVSTPNKNRTSTNTANLTFFSDPTDANSTDGTVIDKFFVGSTSGTNTQTAPQAQLQQQDEWVIGNSTYILQIDVSTTAASVRVWGAAVFYEESNTSIL
jgi:hypothetical protein